MKNLTCIKYLCLSIYILILFLIFLSNIFAQDIDDCAFSKNLINLTQLGKVNQRPILSGPELIIYTTNFKIHYTFVGTDSTTQAWAESTAVYAEYCWFICSSLGWLTPPPDYNMGGDNKYDIYIRNTLADGYFGGAFGENPYPDPYPDGYTSWIEIYKDSLLRPLSKFDGLRSVISHEFHHAVQARYSISELTQQFLDIGKIDTYHPWIYENTAVFMEDIIYDDVNSLVKFRFDEGPDPLDSVHLPISYSTGGYEYCGALWPTFLHEYFGNNIVRSIWEEFGRVAGENVFTGIDTTLKRFYNSNLETALEKYAIWRYFTGTRADNFHFSEGASYPNSFIRIVHDFDDFKSYDQGTYYPSGPGGTSYIKYNPGTPVLNLYFNGQNNYQWSAYLIGEKTTALSEESRFSLNSFGDGNLQMITLDKNAIILVPIITQWRSKAKELGYTYRASVGAGAPVQFLNRIRETNAGGKLLLLPFDEINSGDYRLLNSGQNYSVKTMNERFETDSIYKHNNWNSQSPKFNLSNSFIALPGENQVANFIGLNPATIRNELIDAPSLNGGSVDFRDPWYLHDASGNQYNRFDPFPSPYRPTGAYNETAGGVFLNQGYPRWAPPYYSVRVPQSQRIGAYNSNFAYWTSSKGSEFQIPNALETGVVFKHANDTIKAVYKGHRISSTNTALHSNNQRKLVYVKPSPNSNYNLFLAYESGGKLWLTSSTNNGQDWQLENYIGNGNYISIGQMEPEFGNLILTWQENKSNKKYVYASTGTPNTSILDSNISVSIDPKPVIGILTKNLNKIPPDTINQTAICVVWKGDNSLRYSYFAGLLPKSGSLSWSPASNIYNTNSTHKNPSIAYVKIDSVNYRFYLTYDDGYKIYLRTAVFSGSDINWSHAVVVDSFAFNAQIYAERISNNLSIVHFVYERVNQYGKFIRYRNFTDNGCVMGQQIVTILEDKLSGNIIKDDRRKKIEIVNRIIM